MTVPLWALALMLVPDPGFLIYLGVQNAYYGIAQRVFGATLFPTDEFGTFARGAGGIALGALLYGLMGGAAGSGAVFLWQRATASRRH
jgi:hypothetical protein